MRVIFLLAILCLNLLASASAKTLLIAGDSLSAGYGLPTAQSWPALLQQSLQQQGTDWTLQNASISGETSAGVMARLPALLKQYQPAAVLIEIGGNDGLRGFPVMKLKQNLQQIIEQVKAAGAEPILMQIRIPPNYGPKYTEQFVAVYPELAKTAQIRLWPFFMDQIATQPELMQADGIHPNSKAQPIIRDFMLTLIKEM